jgi:hypothetical protein
MFSCLRIKNKKQKKGQKFSPNFEEELKILENELKR